MRLPFWRFVYVVAWWWLRAAFIAGLGGWWSSIWVPALFGLAAVFAALGQSERVSAFALLLVTAATFVGVTALALLG